MQTSALDYNLPDELIAQQPPDCRIDSRLLVLGRNGIEHASFSDMPRFLEPGDALILNDTRVIPARLRGRKSTGGAVEILLVEGGARYWRCMARGSGLKQGVDVTLGEGVTARLIERKEGFWEVEFDTDIEDGGLLKRIGEAPTPPYIRERLKDEGRYQTVYAKEPGAIAAPTAGLHFTREMLDGIAKRGVTIERLTLHIGPGTFLPVRTETIEEHGMHPELVRVKPETAEVLNRVRREGGRWCAVGTSTVRALESACTPDGIASAVEAPTNVFICPGYEFRSKPELFLTNFHLPRSTNLALTCTYGGTHSVMDAYVKAVDMKYRFYSFGDAMLIEGEWN